MTTQARRVAIGDNTAVADIEPGKQQVSPVAVLGLEDGPVEGKAGRLAHEVGAELLDEGALDDEDVGAKDLARCDLSVGVAVGAGSVDNLALLYVLVLMWRVRRRRRGTNVVCECQALVSDNTADLLEDESVWAADGSQGDDDYLGCGGREGA